MEAYQIVSRISKLGKYLGLLTAILLLLNISAVMAVDAGGPGTIKTTLEALCKTMKDVLGIGVVLMIILSAVIYAVGQTMGAETRARATVWATAMFTGAIMAAIIYLLAPWIITQIAPDIPKGAC